VRDYLSHSAHSPTMLVLKHVKRGLFEFIDLDFYREHGRKVLCLSVMVPSQSGYEDAFLDWIRGGLVEVIPWDHLQELQLRLSTPSLMAEFVPILFARQLQTMHLTTQSIIGVDELIADHMMEPGLDEGPTVSSPFSTLNTLCAVEQNVIELVPLLQDWRSDGIQLRRLILENCELGGMDLGMIANHLQLQRDNIAQVTTKRHGRSITSGSGRLCPITILRS
jgi:hypothetical protein